MRNDRSRSLTKEDCRYEQCAKRSLIAQEIPPERHREKAGGAVQLKQRLHSTAARKGIGQHFKGKEGTRTIRTRSLSQLLRDDVYDKAWRSSI